MEEKLVHAAFGTAPALFRPTSLLFSDTTNNTSHPQAYCDGNLMIIECFRDMVNTFFLNFNRPYQFRDAIDQPPPHSRPIV